MAARRERSQPALSPDHYFHRAKQPLASLIFLLPLLIAYEVGAYFYLTQEELGARTLLRLFFSEFGAVGEYLPGLAIVAVLLSWHIAKRDPWRFEPRVYAAMAVESLALTAPAVIFSLLVGRQVELAMATLGAVELSFAQDLVMSFGAGPYEELVFRLILIAAVHALLVDVLGVADQWGAVAAVIVSSVAFGLYHFSNPEQHTFTWAKMAYFTLLGLYFSILYVVRGLGIAAATHALFDVVVVILRHEVYATA